LAAKGSRRSNAIRFQGALPDSPARHDRGGSAHSTNASSDSSLLQIFKEPRRRG
jgi:hypothetical protein